MRAARWWMANCEFRNRKWLRSSQRSAATNACQILNDNPSGTVYVATMTKLIALVAAGLFAAGTMFAGEHGDCSKKVGNEAKAACQASLASLNLTPEQKTKMDAVMAEHEQRFAPRAISARSAYGFDSGQNGKGNWVASKLRKRSRAEHLTFPGTS